MSDEDIVERLRRRAAKARDRYPDHADDPTTLVGGLIEDYESAAVEIERLRDRLKGLARDALGAMRGPRLARRADAAPEPDPAREDR